MHLLVTSNFEEIKDFCLENHIDMVIPSGEDHLYDGIVDYLKDKIPVPNSIFKKDMVVFGPNKNQASIEGNKYYSKCMMKSLNIPTSPFSFYINKSFSDHRQADKCVIKYAGLAKGKGVYLPKDGIEKRSIINKLYDDFKGTNWKGIIIEDRLRNRSIGTGFL